MHQLVHSELLYGKPTRLPGHLPGHEVRHRHVHSLLIYRLVQGAMGTVGASRWAGCSVSNSLCKAQLSKAGQNRCTVVFVLLGSTTCAEQTGGQIQGNEMEGHG